MRLYHRTRRANAKAILIGGFRDGRGNSLTKGELSGVWLSDRPLDANEEACGDILLRIDLRLPKKEIEKYEWKEDGRRFREFLIPATLVNTHGKVVVFEVDD